MADLKEPKWSSLDAVNAEFLARRRRQKRKKAGPRVKSWIFLLGLMILAFGVLTYFSWRERQTSEPPAKTTAEAPKSESAAATGASEQAPSSLTTAEQKKWTEKQQDAEGEMIYVEMNDEVSVQGTTAYLRLMNPIYSTNYLQIRIYPKENKNKILYDSEMLAPGTILEAVRLSEEPTEQQTDIVVLYTVYDAQGVKLGTHPVTVVMSVQEAI